LAWSGKNDDPGAPRLPKVRPFAGLEPQAG
jgi:hypothetical protein